MSRVSARRPNVLLVTLDQFRADCSPANPDRLVRTPTLDRLAAAGVTFTNHWAQAAPCGPSRASLLTGRYLHNHRSALNGTPLDDRFDNIARHARRNGFDPVLFGYTDTTLDPRLATGPDDPALHTYESVLPGFRAVVDLTEDLKPWGEWLRDCGYEVGDDVEASMYRQADVETPPDRGASWAPTIYAAEHTESAFLAESIIDWLGPTASRLENRAPSADSQSRSERSERGRTNEGAEGEPWFVHASFLRPHPPYQAPPGYHDLYDPADVELPRRAIDPPTQGAIHPMVAGALMVDMACSPESELDVRQLRATYYGMITEVDAQLGRVIDHLDATGQLEDTIVIVTSDHGEQLGDQWLVQKLGFYDASYAIPLIVSWPAGLGSRAGSRVDAPTENIDVWPTIAELLDVDPPVGIDGVSLAPWLRGETPTAWRDAVHWEWDFRQPDSTLIEDHLGITMRECNLSVLRDQRGKYVHFAGLPPLFFDLVEDPHETTNLAEDPAHRTEVLEYAQRMLSWRMSHDDDTLAGFVVTEHGMFHR